MATKYALDPAEVGVVLGAPGMPTGKGWEIVTPEMWKFRWDCFDKIMMDEPDYYRDPDWYVDVTKSYIMAKLWEENPEMPPAELAARAVEKYLDEQIIRVKPYSMLLGHNTSDGHGIIWEGGSSVWPILVGAWEATKRVYVWENGKKTQMTEDQYKLLERFSGWYNMALRVKQDMTEEEWFVYYHPPQPGRYFEPMGTTGLRANPDYDWCLRIGLRKLLEMKLEKQREYERELKAAVGPRAEELRRKILNCQMSVRSTEAVMKWIKRMAAEARKAAPNMPDAKARQYAEEAAANCEWIAENPPRTFWEAVQLQYACFVVFYCLETTNNTLQFLPDRVFYEWYERDVLKEKTLSRVQAGEIIACWMAQYAEIGSLMSRFGGLAKAGQGTRDFSVWTYGGQDSQGQDATTDLTHLFLDVQDGYRFQFPDYKYRWCPKTSKDDLRRVVEVMRTGLGIPSIRSDEVAIPSMMDMYPGEVSLEEARNWAVVGCNSPGTTTNSKGACRRDALYPQITKAVEFALFNGRDPEPGFEWFKSVETGDPTKFKDFEEFYQAWLKQWDWIVSTEVRLRNIAFKRWAETCRRPFLSLLYKGCYETGDDIVEYDMPRLSFQSIVGWVDSMNSLAAVKNLVYEKKKYTMAQLVEACRADWEGYEEMRRDFQRAPKFGNDMDEADEVFVRAVRDVYALGRTLKDGRGSPVFLNALPISFMYMAAPMIGALPDGRKRNQPLCDGGINPHAQSDWSGPWARMRSATKVDQSKFKAWIYNQKFDYPSVEGDVGLEKLLSYVDTALMEGMSQMQFNFISKEMLRDAQEHPEKYPYLSVRVSGYAAFFVGLPKFLQDAVMDRVDHKL